MKNLCLVFLLVTFVSCSEQKEPLPGETEFQLEMNASYKDASTSPLKEKDRKSFRGLDFFKFDSTYVVSAKIVFTPDEKPFEMKTTTDRRPVYVKYGIVEFLIKGNPYQLNIYQNLDLLKKEGYEDYLFLPFLDNTNGEESYGGGRYVECRIPEGDNLAIDFNTAYNPYCAYNDKYSCPIVPRENYLDVEVRAGVKTFGKH